MVDRATMALVEMTDVDGHNDYSKIVDTSEALPENKDKSVKAKHSTGGMIAHGDAVKAFYRFNFSNEALDSYIKIASLPVSAADTGDKIRIILHVAGAVGSQNNELEINLGNRNALYQRVVAINSSDISAITMGGIKTFINAGALDVYVFNAASTFCGVSVELFSHGFNNIATIIAPNKVTTITSPTGTLSLDTTAGKYANGVPDGNEDWKPVAYANGSGTVSYRRHSNGIVEVAFTATTVTTTTDGTTMFTLPAGYRSLIERVAALHVNNAGGSAGELIIFPTGVVALYGYASGAGSYRSSIMFMAEA